MPNLRSNAQITIITKDGKLTLDSIRREVLQVTTQKDLVNSAGAFQIVLSARIAKSLANTLGATYLPEIVKPYDLVQIAFKTSGNYKTEMIGFVSRASLSLSVDASTGRPTRTLTIDGFDLTKAIQNFKLFFNPYVVNEDLAEAFGGMVYFNTKKTRAIFRSKNSAEFIKTFLAQAFMNVYNTSNPKKQSPYYGFVFGKQSSSTQNTNPDGLAYDKTVGIKLNDLIDFEGGISTAFKTNTMIDPYVLLGLGAGVEVSIWDIAKSYSDPPFHECFMDLRRAGQNYTYAIPQVDSDLPLDAEGIKAAEDTHQIPPKSGVQNSPYVFYMRTTPFSQQSWSKLSYHTFSPADILAQNTSTSEDNIFNYYQVLCERENVLVGEIQVAAMSAVSQDKGLGRPRIPIFDLESIKNYGFKRFPSDKTKYVDFLSNSKPGTKAALYSGENFVIKAQATLARELLRWYSFGELFETGIITLKGRVGIGIDGATIGSRLIEVNGAGKQTGKQFYIEGVSQSWVFGKGLETTLAVSRGHFPDNYVDAVTGEAKSGRFNKVKQLEKDLRLDQESNGQFFNDPYAQ